MVHVASKFRSRSERPNNFRVRSLLKDFCQFDSAGTQSANGMIDSPSLFQLRHPVTLANNKPTNIVDRYVYEVNNCIIRCKFSLCQQNRLPSLYFIVLGLLLFLLLAKIILKGINIHLLAKHQPFYI